MAKRIALGRIKKNKAYTAAELALATGTTEATVRRWVHDGMDAIDIHRPILIMGFSASAYLKKRQSGAKRPMQLDELYCMRCKAPRKPYGMMVDYLPKGSSGGRLVALCGHCECVCNRNISASQLPVFAQHFEIAKKGQ